MQETQQSNLGVFKASLSGNAAASGFTSDHIWLEFWSCRFKLREQFYVFTNSGRGFWWQGDTTSSWKAKFCSIKIDSLAIFYYVRCVTSFGEKNLVMNEPFRYFNHTFIGKRMSSVQSAECIKLNFKDVKLHFKKCSHEKMSSIINIYMF